MSQKENDKLKDDIEKIIKSVIFQTMSLNDAIDELNFIIKKSKIGVFTAEDMKYAYELGRLHEKNGSDVTSEIMKDAFVGADKLDKGLMWK